MSDTQATNDEVVSVLNAIKRWYRAGAASTKKFTLGDYQLSVWKTADGLISFNFKNIDTKKSEFSMTKRGIITEDLQYVGGCLLEILGDVDVIDEEFQG